MFQFCVRASVAGNSDGEEGGKKMIRREKDGWKIYFAGEKPPTQVLDTINFPVQMKNLSPQVKHSFLYVTT